MSLKNMPSVRLLPITPNHMLTENCTCKWNCVTWCGFSPHSGREVMEFFNENYEGRWIGRNGMVAWSAESRDMSPLDFFLWGCIKRVY